MPDSALPAAAPVPVRTLLGHRDVELAAHCLATMVHCSADPVQLVIHEDGSLTAADAIRLGEALPGARIIRRNEADARMREKLAHHPQAQMFRETSVWGLKLLDMALCEPGDCYYLDSDIRFFRPFQGLFCRPGLAGRSVFLRDTVWTAYSIRPWHLWGRRRLRVVEGINTGLSLIDRALYDLDFVEWFLTQPDWRVIPAWTEPTCWAALAARTNGHAADPAQITNLYPGATVTDETVGAHFLSAYRGCFAAELAAPVAQEKAAAKLRFQPLRPLGAVSLGLNQLMRKASNQIACNRRPPAAKG
jgi:hypothetical protein